MTHDCTFSFTNQSAFDDLFCGDRTIFELLTGADNLVANHENIVFYTKPVINFKEHRQQKLEQTELKGTLKSRIGPQI